MVESTLAVQTSSEAGTRIDDDMTVVDNTGGSKFLNDGLVMLWVTSGIVSPVLTVTGQGACAFGVTHNRTYTCTAAQSHLIGPFSESHFNDTSNLCHITWSISDSSTKVVAIRCGQTMG